MTDEQIAFSIAAMKKYGIVDSGDALTMGIGAMTDARWESFFTKSVIWGVYPADLPYKTGYTHEVRQPGPRARPAEAAHRRVSARAPAEQQAGDGTRPRRWSPARRATRSSPTARRRWPASTSRSAGTSSSSLLGPSGCGKSTALRLIAGLGQASGGADRLAAAATALGDIGFVFQEPTLMPWATVFDNVWLPLRLQGQRPRRGARRGRGGAGDGRASTASPAPIRASCRAA